MKRLRRSLRSKLRRVDTSDGRASAFLQGLAEAAAALSAADCGQDPYELSPEQRIDTGTESSSTDDREGAPLRVRRMAL